MHTLVRKWLAVTMVVLMGFMSMEASVAMPDIAPASNMQNMAAMHHPSTMDSYHQKMPDGEQTMHMHCHCVQPGTSGHCLSCFTVLPTAFLLQIDRVFAYQGHTEQPFLLNPAPNSLFRPPRA